MAHHQDLTFGQRFIAGGVAGVVEVLVMYPTDVVKTRMQLSREGASRGMIGLFRDLFVHEKGRIYRGLLAPVITEAPKRALKFSANETYKPMMRAPDGSLSVPGAMVAGSLAGVTEAFFVIAPEFVKVRMQSKEYAGMYKSSMDCVKAVYRTEGASAFLTGSTATILRNGVWNMGYFGAIDALRKMLWTPSDSLSTHLRNLLAGAGAGIIGTALNTPFDVVKSRLQARGPGAPARPVDIRPMEPLLIYIARTEGPRALWSGFTPKVLRLGPGGGILLVVFEAVSSFLKKH